MTALIRYPDESGVKHLEEVATGIGCQESLVYRRDPAALVIHLIFIEKPHRAGTASPLH